MDNIVSKSKRNEFRVTFDAPSVRVEREVGAKGENHDDEG